MSGQGKVQAKQVADAMLDAVIEVVNQNSSSTLQSIRIIIFQSPMLKDFNSSMQERQVPSAKSTTWMQSISNTWKGIKGEVNEKGNVSFRFQYALHVSFLDIFFFD